MQIYVTLTEMDYTTQANCKSELKDLFLHKKHKTNRNRWLPGRQNNIRKHIANICETLSFYAKDIQVYSVKINFTLDLLWRKNVALTCIIALQKPILKGKLHIFFTTKPVYRS